MINIGKVIATLRKENHLTQKELGELLNASYQAISKWENGLSEPDLEMLQKMANIFQVPTSIFFGSEKDNQENVNNEYKKNLNQNKSYLKSKLFYIVFSISFVFVCLIFYALISTANSKITTNTKIQSVQ